MWKIILGSISLALSIILLIGASLIEDLNGSLTHTCETLYLIGTIFLLIPATMFVYWQMNNV